MNVLVLGTREVNIVDLLEKSLMIIPIIAGIMKVSKSEVRRVIKQKGIKYVGKNGELETLTEEDMFFYGIFKFKYGKHRWYVYRTLET